MSEAERRARGFTHARQRLGRAGDDPAAVLRAVVGVYSAHPTAPLSLLARCDPFAPGDFRGLDGLRLPAMRASIHLLPRETAHLAFRAVAWSRAANLKQLEYEGIDAAQYEQLRSGILDLAREPATARQLRAALPGEPRIGPVLSAMTREGVLMRLGAQGLRSNELLYVRTEVAEAEPGAALAWLAGEYLRAFGPARVEDFAWWAGVSGGRARSALDAHATVDVGDGLLLRAEDEPEFAAAEPPSGVVDMLPKWDCYTMGYPAGGRSRFAGADVAGELYDFRGDGLPVILVDGEAAGTWSVRAGGGLDFEITMFDSPTPAVRAALERSAGAVRALLSA